MQVKPVWGRFCYEPFYVLDVQPNLFGEWSLVREWGRIGMAQRSLSRESRGRGVAGAGAGAAGQVGYKEGPFSKKGFIRAKGVLFTDKCLVIKS
ncbi:MAG: WGR domain-containing protein [Rhodomicrobium sp.]